ncbi:MAG: T9SS type A sorting domain-containing protein, partial [Bacteroidales bacterium]|nr:T9SS type A sorting domain-containing protein [Bacteroidales bacterium]
KDSAVGIDDLSEEYTVSVVNKTIQILSDKNTSISIFDLQGKCLYRNNNTMEAVVSVPQTGVYAVKIGGNQQIVVVR